METCEYCKKDYLFTKKGRRFCSGKCSSKSRYIKIGVVVRDDVDFIEGESWLPIKEYIGYEISSIGRVKSLSKPNNQFSKTIIIKSHMSNGYPRIAIRKNNLSRKFVVHRLVAEAFIPNSENKLQVNHINGIKHDNRVENLEWCTQSENMKHAYKLGLRIQNSDNSHRSKKVINTITGEIFNSIKQACIGKDYSYAYFRKMLNNKYENTTEFKLL